MSRLSSRHLIALLASLFFWGLSFPMLKIAVQTNDPLSILFFRYLISLVLLVPYWLVAQRKETGMLFRHRYLLAIGLFNFLGSWLQFSGLRFTTAMKSSILTQLMVVVVPLMAYFILRERMDIWKTAAILFSLIGAVTLSTRLHFEGLLQSGTFKGDALTIAAVVFWSLFIVYTRKWVQKISSFWLMLANYLAVVGLSLPLVIFTHRTSIDSTGLLISLILAVFCTILPTALYNYSLKAMEATTSTIIGPLEVLSTLFFSFLFLGERMTGIEAGGALMIAVSVYLITRKSTEKT